MTASGVELVDVNVWLALVFSDHVHQKKAVAWFDQGQLGQFAFCRITQMGLLRHLTNRTIMGKFVLGQRKAWKVYDQLQLDDRVTFLGEPPKLELQWRALTAAAQPRHRLWTDAYLAAFARVQDISLVSCDRGLGRFRGVKLNVLL